MWIRSLVAAATAVLTAVAAAPAHAAVDETADAGSAVCESHQVRVRAPVEVKAEPDVAATTLFTAQYEEHFTCTAVTVGGEHSRCGASGSEVWLVITDFERFDVYAPSSCLADVRR